MRLTTTSSSISRHFFSFIPTKPNGAPTFWKQLRELLAFEIASGGQVSMVNRLDRETSGLVLVAKTAAAAREFGLLMQRHSLRKEYLAIVWGWPEWEHKLVDAPLDRQGKYQDSVIWLKQTIHAAGAPAQTELFVERRFRKIDLVRRSLQRHSRDSTHRTHSSDSGASQLNGPPNCG